MTGRAVADIAHDRGSAETCDPCREPAGELPASVAGIRSLGAGSARPDFNRSARGRDRGGLEAHQGSAAPAACLFPAWTGRKSHEDRDDFLRTSGGRRLFPAGAVLHHALHGPSGPRLQAALLPTAHGRGHSVRLRHPPRERRAGLLHPDPDERGVRRPGPLQPDRRHALARGVRRREPARLAAPGQRRAALSARHVRVPVGGGPGHGLADARVSVSAATPPAQQRHAPGRRARAPGAGRGGAQRRPAVDGGGRAGGSGGGSAGRAGLGRQPDPDLRGARPAGAGGPRRRAASRQPADDADRPGDRSRRRPCRGGCGRRSSATAGRRRGGCARGIMRGCGIRVRRMGARAWRRSRSSSGPWKGNGEERRCRR